MRISDWSSDVCSSDLRNALNADGSVRGESDKAIDNGLSPEVAAARILDAVAAGTRELVVAEGAEAEIPALRRSDPDALFDQMSAMVQAGYAAQMGAGSYEVEIRHCERSEAMTGVKKKAPREQEEGRDGKKRD